jgi:L-2-hydroxyglutarate oxidase LhgO
MGIRSQDAALAVDAVVVGAGVIGLATGRALARQGLQPVVIEAGAQIGQETSARHSGVIHAGIYYRKGSRKAALCVEGKGLLYEFLARHRVPHARPGKLIVAARADEVEALARIEATAQAAGVQDLERLDRSALRAIEPAVQGQAALLSPSTGIVDAHQYLLALQGSLERRGGSVVCNTPLLSARQRTGGGFELMLGGAQPATISTPLLVNAGGLRAREVLAMVLGDQHAHLPAQHFAVGHYYSYSAPSPFARLVYPVPAPGGLGVHATLDLAGRTTFGPDVRWQVAPDYRFDDSRRVAFAQAIEAYFPDLDRSRLQPGYTGVRPKVVGPDEGDGDFQILGQEHHGVQHLVSLHGIESPGLTASLAIARVVAEMLRR